MADHRDAARPPDDPTRVFDGAFRIVAILAVVLVVLMVVRVASDATGGPPSGSTGAAASAGDPTASPDPASFLLADPRRAPAIDLTGPDGGPVSLAAQRGGPVLVFFGYTHCPDVCPATIGRVGEAIAAVGGAARALFVTIDPERDTVPWLATFARYLPAGFGAATGTPAAIRFTADAWGVRYARVDGPDATSYSMAHTADVFLVDAAGMIRATFPFGTEASSMSAVLQRIGGGTDGSAASRPTSVPTATVAPSTAVASTGPAADLFPQVVSSSVWAGGHSPVILALFDDAGGRIDDPGLVVTAQLVDADGGRTGPVAPAVAVQPVGVREVSFVPTIDFPTPGRWRLAVTATNTDGSQRHGVAEVTALDPGGTATLGVAAPTVRTPTAADFGGDQTWVTTDPLPDPRLTRTSTTDALAAGTPFVFVVNSVRFRVTPVCGRAVVMAKQLVDRWPNVPFIHHEPYRFTVVTQEPVLEGSLADPHLTDAAEAWGVGSDPWGVASMPWIFVVDGDGVVRAKYQGVMGSADVDVILSLLVAAS